MSLDACILCHRDALVDRWVGDLHRLFCTCCGNLYLDPITPSDATPRGEPVTVPVVPPAPRGWPHVALAARLRG